MENGKVKLSASRRLRRAGVKIGKTFATKGLQNMIILFALKKVKE